MGRLRLLESNRCESSACAVSISKATSYVIEFPNRDKITIGIFIPVKLCNPRPTHVCFNWKNVPFEIEWTRSWASELTWRLIVSEVTWCVSFVERSKRRISVNTFGIDSKRFCKLSTVGGHGKLSAVSMYSSTKSCKIPAASFTTGVSFNVIEELRDSTPVVTSRQE